MKQTKEEKAPPIVGLTDDHAQAYVTLEEQWEELRDHMQTLTDFCNANDRRRICNDCQSEMRRVTTKDGSKSIFACYVCWANKSFRGPPPYNPAASSMASAADPPTSPKSTQPFSPASPKRAPFSSESDEPESPVGELMSPSGRSPQRRVRRAASGVDSRSPATPLSPLSPGSPSGVGKRKHALLPMLGDESTSSFGAGSPVVEQDDGSNAPTLNLSSSSFMEKRSSMPTLHMDDDSQTPSSPSRRLIKKQATWHQSLTSGASSPMKRGMTRPLSLPELRSTTLDEEPKVDLLESTVGRNGKPKLRDALDRVARDAYAGSKSAEVVFQDFDANRDGLLSKDELKLGLRRLGSFLTAFELDSFVGLFSSRDDGAISFQAFLETLNKYKEKYLKARDLPTDPLAAAWSNSELKTGTRVKALFTLPGKPQLKMIGKVLGKGPAPGTYEVRFDDDPTTTKFVKFNQLIKLESEKALRRTARM